MEKTGFNQKKVTNILQRSFKQGKIETDQLFCVNHKVPVSIFDGLMMTLITKVLSHPFIFPNETKSWLKKVLE